MVFRYHSNINNDVNFETHRVWLSQLKFRMLNSPTSMDTIEKFIETYTDRTSLHLDTLGEMIEVLVSNRLKDVINDYISEFMFEPIDDNYELERDIDVVYKAIISPFNVTYPNFMFTDGFNNYKDTMDSYTLADIEKDEYRCAFESNIEDLDTYSFRFGCRYEGARVYEQLVSGPFEFNITPIYRTPNYMCEHIQRDIRSNRKR